MAAATAQRHALEVTRADGSILIIPGRARRVQQTITNMVANDTLGVSSLTNPGLRLSHYVFILRTEYGLPIHMEKVEQPGGVGWYGSYTLRERVRLRPLNGTRPTTVAAESVSYPVSTMAGAEASE